MCSFNKAVRFNIGTLKKIVLLLKCSTNIYMILQEHFLVYCGYRDVVKLFRFLMMLIFTATLLINQQR
jgi:hypothetical protein